MRAELTCAGVTIQLYFILTGMKTCIANTKVKLDYPRMIQIKLP